MDIYREEIYVSSFSGPAGLKRGSINSYLTQICSNPDLLFAYWRIIKMGFHCVQIVAFGTMNQLDKIRSSCHPNPNSPIQWYIHPRYPTSVEFAKSITKRRVNLSKFFFRMRLSVVSSRQLLEDLFTTYDTEDWDD